MFNKITLGLVILLCYYVASQPAVPPSITVFQDQAIIAPGFPEIFGGNVNCPNEAFLATYTGGSTFTIRPHSTFVFDLASEYNGPTPGMMIDFAYGEFIVSGTNPWSFAVVGTLNSFTAERRIGTTTPGDFQFSFSVPATATPFTYDPSADPTSVFGVMVNVGTAASSPAATSVQTGTFAADATSEVYFDMCLSTFDQAGINSAMATSSAATAPALRIYDCQAYTLDQPCGMVDNPLGTDIFVIPDTCEADVTYSTAQTLVVSSESDGQNCPYTFTRTETIPEVDTISTVTLPANNPGNSYTTMYEYTLAAGATSTCTNTFRVVDNQVPNVPCPGSFQLATSSATCDATFNPVDDSDDNCMINQVLYDIPGVTMSGPTSTPIDIPVGTYTATKNVTDIEGNFNDTCVFSIVVIDGAGPTAVCSAPVTLIPAPGSCSVVHTFTEFVDYNTTGCEAPYPTTTDLPATFEYPLGVTEFVVTAFDSQDNTGTCNITVTVEDQELPIVTCPGDITVDTPGTAPVPVFFTFGATDNCNLAAASCSSNSGQTFGLGTTQVNCSAVDTSSNSAIPCSFNVIVTQVPPLPTPIETIVAQPSPSATNSPTNAVTPTLQQSREQVDPSFSQTPSRTPNPSTTSTASESPTPSSSPTRTPSRTPSPTPSSTPTPTPSRTPSSTPIIIDPSITPSPFIPSLSPSSTPLVVRTPFVQTGRATLVEFVLPCGQITCTLAEIEFYVNLIALELGISITDISYEGVFGHEVTIIICESADVAALLNQITFETAPVGFEDVFVESAVFDVLCPLYQPVETTGSATSITASIFLVLGFLFI